MYSLSTWSCPSSSQAQPGDDGLVFVGPFGGRLCRSNFRDLWIKARDGVGLLGAASARFASYGEHDGCGDRGEPSGADERMGHSSTRAAMIYRHATRERDEAIAIAMGEALTRAREARGKGGSGTQRARERGNAS